MEGGLGIERRAREGREYERTRYENGEEREGGGGEEERLKGRVFEKVLVIDYNCNGYLSRRWETDSCACVSLCRSRCVCNE